MVRLLVLSFVALGARAEVKEVDAGNGGEGEKDRHGDTRKRTSLNFTEHGMEAS